MNSTCERCLNFWRSVLEHDCSEMWFVRSLPDNTIWANATAREKFGVPEVLPWEHAMRWAFMEDAHLIEDVHSLALKTMAPQVLEFRFKAAVDKLVVLKTCLTPYRCSGCRLHCGMLIILAQEVMGVDASGRVTEASDELHP